jgi:hypothetical protein
LATPALKSLFGATVCWWQIIETGSMLKGFTSRFSLMGSVFFIMAGLRWLCVEKAISIYDAVLNITTL